MKRLLTLALIVFMIVSLAVMVWANDYPVDSAFIDQDVLDADYWDDPDTLELGGHGQPIQYVNGYGVGYSSLNDQVIYSKLDFGDNGADQFIINFSFGGETSALLNVYIDEKSDKPAATLEIGNTGGWEEVWAEEAVADIDVPGGKHDVIVEFANDQSGSFTYIRFHEKEGAAAKDYPVDSAFIDQDVLDADYWDDPDTLELGGHGQPIQYVNGYGVGYSSLNDQVIYSKLDFGENGADKFIINFSFGADTSAILNVYIDEKSDKPAATLEIPNTGGWEEVWAQEFEADIDVPGGKHDVIVEFANDQSGSFTYIRFHEKEGTAAKDYPVDSAFIDQDVLDADYWDDPDTLELGGHGQPIQYVNGYGVGYSSLNDQVIYSKLDFGENGADKFIINFSFGADTSAILNVYIDEKSDKPAATLEIPNTGGWEEVWAQEFEADIDVPGGKHDVIVEFANDQSGSFTYIRFNEKAEASAPAVEKSISMPKTEFTVGEAVLVTASGEGKDWVGLYKEGDVPGGPASTAWYYVTEHNGEEYAITSDLPAGNYTMGLYLNDGYDLFGEAIPFTVVAEEVPAADSKGLASVEEAADGKNIITGYEFVSGTNGNGGEGPENLWDGNTATKFCTGEFPIESMAKLDGVYDITGFTMATANDNADWNGRSPSAWTISVSADGENWNELASGDDSFFEETNFTYYVGEGTASGVSYVKFNAEGAPSGCFQVSEVTLFGDKAVSVDEFLEKKEEAPNTFDFGIIAAVAAIISLGGFAVSKKRK